MSQLVTLHIDSKQVSVLCHLGDFGCGDGGWTTVMKIDGNKVCHLSTGAIFIEHIINGTEKKMFYIYYWVRLVKSGFYAMITNNTIDGEWFPYHNDHLERLIK